MSTRLKEFYYGDKFKKGDMTGVVAYIGEIKNTYRILVIRV